MSLFGRRKRSEEPARHGEDLLVRRAEAQEAVQAAEQSADNTRRGPYDAAEVPEEDSRIDLGSLRIAGAQGMELRIEIDQANQSLLSVSVAVGDSFLQMQAFAAPRTEGIWDEIREEIASSVTSQNGTAETVSGPLGPELRTRMPAADPQGRTVFAPARFLGVDGPRWFLRGVITGRAAIDEAAADPLIDVFCSTVVVRGSDPMAPRELLPLRMPVAEEMAAEPPTEDGPARDDLDPFTRGPEITEVR